VAALFAAPMTDEQFDLYREHTGRTVAPSKPFTEAALVVGRRGGKSRLLAFVAVALATMRDYEPHLSAGEVATIGVLAATTKQGRSIFNYVLGLLRAIPCLRPMIVEDTNDTILLSNRVQIEIAAASFRSTRGYTYAAVLADEIAFWRSEESLNPDVEILRALRPGLASIPGSGSSSWIRHGVILPERWYGSGRSCG
jgi:phage terminase large subunit-like protein